MSLPVAATTEEIEETRAWTRGFYNGIKSDIPSWVAQYYQPDAVLNFGNSPPIKGHQAISDSFENQRAQRTSTKHGILHVDVFSDRIYVQTQDTYVVKNDPEQKEIKIKTLVLIWKKVDEDKLSSIDIYLDPTPLLERIQLHP